MNYDQAALANVDDELLKQVENAAPEAERLRRPDRAVIAELGQRGLMRLVVPESMGGGGYGPAELVELTRQLSFAHPSTGWVAMTCNEEATLAASYLSPSNLASFYAHNPAAVIAGSGVPRGSAKLVDDGCVVTGRWTFATGCTAADYWVVVALVDKASLPANQQQGPRQMCAVMMPAEPTMVDDTWHTIGMRATGSADIVLEDVFVPSANLGLAHRPKAPDARSAQPPVLGGHAYFSLPAGLRFPFPKVGVAVGTAQRAIAEFKRLADAKQPLFAKQRLAERADAQAAVAHATALVSSSYAFATEQLEVLCELASVGDAPSNEQHASARLACSWVLRSCISAVAKLASAAGSTANFTHEPNSLGNLLADLQATAGHFMVGPQQIDTAGRVLLGEPSGDPNF